MCCSEPPHYYASLRYPGICAQHGDTVLPLESTFLGRLCSDCRSLCAHCDDWLLGDSIEIDGHRYHASCAVDREAAA